MSTGTSLVWDLWILNRNKPVEIWQLTADGKSSDPNWSLQNPSTPSCKAITDASIDGPTSGYTGTAYTFTAVITPTDAEVPIAYTWDPTPNSGQGTSSASYTWPATGAKTITLTVENCGGTVRTDVHTITISASSSGCEHPVSAVSINGPTKGFTDTTYTFTADVTPTDASLPISYTWAPTPDSGQGSAQATYSWATIGVKTINVAVSNCDGAGTASDDHTISIEAAHRIYLPMIVRGFK